MNNQDSPWLVLGSTALAAATAASLVLLQTDAVSRRLVSPTTLQNQRRSWYQRQWRLALESCVQAMRVAHVTSQSQAVKDQAQANEAELLGTEFIKTQAELEVLLQNIMLTAKTASNSSSTAYQIARIGRDTKEHEQHGSVSNEYYIWIQQQQLQTDNESTTLHQVPLSMFAACLAETMERRVTVDTFLFVADGACGVASHLVSRLLECLSEHAVINLQTPVWMVQLAVLMERRALSQATLDQLLLGLCRLQAMLHPATTTAATTTTNTTTRRRTARTMAWIVPSSIVPIMLAPLQRVFPDDRHVVAYAGCHQTVQSALRLLLQQHSSATTPTSQPLSSLLQWQDSVVAATTPLSARLQQSASLMQPRYLQAMAGLSRQHASLVETWMACASAYLALKEDNEKIPEAYLPYVCKLEFLYYGKLEHGSSAYWALRSLLQYMTGTKSTELSASVMEATAKVLAEFTDAYGKLPPITDLSPQEQGAMQEVVFCHKSILIANKVLVDTCLPAEHWQLKQASRKGCSCCVLEAEVEEQMNEAPLVRGLALNGDNNDGEDDGEDVVHSAKSGYIDGTAMFAFDPSRFQ